MFLIRCRNISCFANVLNIEEHKNAPYSLQQVEYMTLKMTLAVKYETTCQSNYCIKVYMIYISRSSKYVKLAFSSKHNLLF